VLQVPRTACSQIGRMTLKTVCVERLSAKIHKLKALLIYRQQIRSGLFAQAFIHKVYVFSPGINFGYIIIGHDTSVSFRKKYLY